MAASEVALKIMNVISSPLKNGDMHSSPPVHYLRWRTAGRIAWLIRRLVVPGDPYLQSLKRQIEKRGPVSPDAWSTPQRKEIADEIISILATACWGESLAFQPNDPWSIVGKCEISNISDIDAAYRIEKTYMLNSPCDELWGKVRDGLTFGEVVTHVEQHKKQG